MQVGRAADDATAALGLAEAVVALLGERPWPQQDVVGVLFDLARVDLTVARAIEPHLDALVILDEAGCAAGPGKYGVFAAEGPGARLVASSSPDGEWVLSGRKAWCSLAATVDRALISAWDGPQRRLFDVDLRGDGVSVSPPQGWVARGLRTVVSTSVDFDGVAARPVGAPQWYFDRPGFSAGAVRVAACWAGGMQALSDQVMPVARQRPDPYRAAAAGDIDVTVWAVRGMLEQVAEQGDARDAARVRTLTAQGAHRVLELSAAALGPGPLAFDERFTRTVADLSLYIGQHHGARDSAALGESL